MFKNLVRHEIVGLDIAISNAQNPTLIGLMGKVINETQNTLTIQTKYGVKKIIKNHVMIKIKLNKKEIEIKGEALIGRPHERIKK